MSRQHLLVVFLCLIGVGSVVGQSSAAPAGPSNLRVIPLGVNAFKMEWQDNSDNETGWEIRVSLGNTDEPKRYLLVPSPNITSYMVVSNDVPGKTLSFQLAAYNGAAGLEEFSEPSSVVVVEAFEDETFEAPVDCTAVTVDDGKIRIGWKDRSTSEHRYEVEIKSGEEDWRLLGFEDPGITFSLPITSLKPETEYSFRVRAFRDRWKPLGYTAYSNTATATTKAFQAPTMLTAKSQGESGVFLSWKDKSSLEEGYEIENKSGTESFASLGTVGADQASTHVNGLAFNTEFQFRVRGFRTVDEEKVYSGYTNVASAKTLFFRKPTDLAGQVISESSVRLTWKNASKVATGFEIAHRVAGTTEFTNLGDVNADATEYTATGLAAGKTYDFRVRAFNEDAYSGPVVIRLRTRDGFTGDFDPPVFMKTSFFYRIVVSRPARLSSLVVSGLPAGLSYDPVQRTIRGIPAVEGVRKVTLKATYDNASTVRQTLVLRIIRAKTAPVAKGEFAPVEVAAGATDRVSLSGRFADPDTRDARRIHTTMGRFDLILYPLATPGTVENFLKYADEGSYNKVFFHRSPEDFVVQGGGYVRLPNGYSKVEAYPSILNEPGISNVAGTVAMAKLGGNPDSATCEFFVNVNDNASNLDNQNGGFTVFGRVAGTGMELLDQINHLPRGTYTVNVGASPMTFEDLPLNVTPPAPTVMDPAKLVKITSIARIVPLRYQVRSSNQAVATAVLDGSNVVITGVASGSARIWVKAIDLDGLMISRPIQVTVP